MLQIRFFVVDKQIDDILPQPSGCIQGFGAAAPEIPSPLRARVSVHLPVVRLPDNPSQESGELGSFVSSEPLYFDFQILRHQLRR